LKRNKFRAPVGIPRVRRGVVGFVTEWFRLGRNDSGENARDESAEARDPLAIWGCPVVWALLRVTDPRSVRQELAETVLGAPANEARPLVWPLKRNKFRAPVGIPRVRRGVVGFVTEWFRLGRNDSGGEGSGDKRRGAEDAELRGGWGARESGWKFGLSGFGHGFSRRARCPALRQARCLTLRPLKRNKFRAPGR